MRGWHSVIRSTFLKLRRAALSSSFDAPTRPAMHSNTITVVSASACPTRNLCLASAACKTCNPGHILCSYFCLANFGFSCAPPPPPQKRHLCVIYKYGSHLRKNIGHVYKNIHVRFWGGGSKERTRFRFFANIGNYGRPLNLKMTLVYMWIRLTSRSFCRNPI